MVCVHYALVLDSKSNLGSGVLRGRLQTCRAQATPPIKGRQRGFITKNIYDLRCVKGDAVHFWPSPPSTRK